MTFSLDKLSVSQVDTFDATQPGGCPRKWFYNGPMGLRPEQSDAQAEGDAGHELLATYLSTGEGPKGRVLMGKAVRGVIEKGELPKPGPDLIVERRFSGQPKRDAAGKWVPLDPTLTPINVGGLPWDGFIDLMYRRGDVPTVWDHKFSSNPRQYAKTREQLIRTVQLPVYALRALLWWPDADRVEIGHHNVSKSGVDSFIVRDVVTRAQIDDRLDEIEQVVREMRQTATAERPDDVPANPKACDAFNGCPHQGICSEFKKRRERPKVELTAEEMALFESATPAAPPKAEPPKVDEQAGWKYVECEACGMPMTAHGKRPPGHKIAPELCPNVKSHDAAAGAAPAPGGGVADKPASLAGAPIAPVGARQDGNGQTVTLPPAAVLPPDAPPNNAAEPAPEKRTRAKKAPEGVTVAQKTTDGHTVRLEIALSADTLAALAELLKR